MLEDIQFWLLIVVLILMLILLWRVFIMPASVRNEISSRTQDISGQIDNVQSITGSKLQSMRDDAGRFEEAMRNENREQRKELSENAAKLRSEIQQQMGALAKGNAERFKEVASLQKEQLEIFGRTLNQRLSDTTEGQAKLTQSLERKQSEIRDKLDEKLRELSNENASKLEEMRKVVDEKLQSTLEKRLSESFKHVGDRLEQVHKGLGEMQTLASSVGDLKRTLTNVKTRGTWGEAQLGSLLADVLTPEQFIANAQIKKNTQERVEFAIKLPGRDDEGRPVLLAIDSKFPTEDYERLLEAVEAGDANQVEASSAALAKAILGFGKDMGSKYIEPPTTVDFAIMYLPSEGLYAEVLRRPGLTNELQTKYRITVAGPTNFSAFLASLQLGFKTLAIEKRSSEVWQVLGAVKTEFEKFGGVLDKVKKKLQEAGNHIDNVDVRTRAIGRKLRSVEELPADEAAMLIETSADSSETLDLERTKSADLDS